MKIDTSSYYPKSHLDDGEEENRAGMQDSIFTPSGHEEKKQDSTTSVPESASDAAEASYSAPTPEPENLPRGPERAISAVSQFLSWIFVPLAMPVYGILLAFGLSILHFLPMSVKTSYTLIVAGINIGLPAVTFYLMKWLGIISDIGLNNQKERFVPYIVTMLCMLGTGFFFWQRHAPMWLVMFFVGGAVAGLINTIVNFRWKISAHTAGIAGIVALLVRIMHEGAVSPHIMSWLVISILASGLLGSARVWLGRHTVMQVICGYAVGFCSVFFLTMIK